MTSRRLRKRRGASAGDETENGKKPKKTKTASACGVVWEWEGDGGNWSSFSPEHSCLLKQALTDEEEEVELQVAGGLALRIRFEPMTQTNLATGWQRNIRCRKDTSSSSVQDTPSKEEEEEEKEGEGVWECKVSEGVWKPLPLIKQRLLKACKVCGVGRREIEVSSRKRCTVDLETMKQVVGRGEKERLRHTFSAALASEATPTPAEATPTSDAASTSGSTEQTDGAAGSLGHMTRLYQGTVPVDYVCSQKIGKAHVYSEGGSSWDAMLNQTNLKNNNNKFYILQLLKDNTVERYSTWFRWGRVGKTGQHQLTDCGSDLEQAKEIFKKKFSDKTLNDWENKENFVKSPGKYDLLQMDYRVVEEVDVGGEGAESGEEKQEKNLEKPVRPPDSQLDERLQSLLRLICDVEAMEMAVMEMKYDTKKAPLGKLTRQQILSGYSALKTIDDCLLVGRNGDELVWACDQFYTRIPHDFGMRRPPIIRTKKEVREKLSLLEALGDIEIALKVLKEGDSSQHPLDSHYHGLHCNLQPLDREEAEFQLVEKYVRQTHAKTHSLYTMSVSDLFRVEREGEKEQFMDVGNRHLLWHGSRLTNWVGILRRGLRIAPSEAPVTGYMFGRGVYFADMSSKSANYCFPSRTHREGVLVLCDVALGQTHDLLAADYHADQLPRGKHSTRGLGKVAPDPAHNHTLPDGCLVPLGPSIETGVNNPSGYTLNYNEFVIYDTKQIKMRYLVKIQFNFK